MMISRRKLLRQMVTGAAATASVPALSRVALGAAPRGALLPEGTDKTVVPIRLSRNENAYGPSANVTFAIREVALNSANRYPEVEAEALRGKIAALHSVAPDQVVLGCG